MGVSDGVTSKTPGERPEELSKVLLEQILAASKPFGAREGGQDVTSQELHGPEADEDCTLTELLAIYKELGRTARADEEALVERLDEMQSAYHELARKRAQMMAQDQQIEVLQDKVVQLNISLLDERWENLNLQGDIERLRIERLQDRRKMDTLVSLAMTDGRRGKPPTYRDCRPQRDVLQDRGTQKLSHKLDWSAPCIHTWTRSSGQACEACAELSKARPATAAARPSAATQGRRAQRPASAPPPSSAAVALARKPAAGSSGSGVVRGSTVVLSTAAGYHLNRAQSRRQVLRTVYLPNERADALIRAVSELHDRFEEFKLISNEQIQMLSEDLRSKDAEYASELRDDEANIHKFTAALQICENDLLRRTREHLELHSALEKNETLKEERKVKHAQDVTVVMAQRDRIEKELEEFSMMNTGRHDVYRQNITTLVQESESSLCLLKEQHQSLERHYQTRIEKLQERIAATQAQRKEVARRGRLDLEGLCRDVLELSRTVDGVERLLGKKDVRTYVKKHQQSSSRGDAAAGLKTAAGGAPAGKKGNKKSVDLAACLAKHEMCSPLDLKDEIDRLTQHVGLLRGLVTQKAAY